MNWLDQETKEILQKETEGKLAPAKVPEFALVMLSKGSDPARLVRALRRVNDGSEEAAIQLTRQPLPVIVNRDLTEAEALAGQFKLICCDAISVFLRTEVLERNDAAYLDSLFRRVLQSPEFQLVAVELRTLPHSEAGQKFADQFLGSQPGDPGRGALPARWRVPFKKARIMRHWAEKVGAEVEWESRQ